MQVCQGGASIGGFKNGALFPDCIPGVATVRPLNAAKGHPVKSVLSAGFVAI